MIDIVVFFKCIFSLLFLSFSEPENLRWENVRKCHVVALLSLAGVPAQAVQGAFIRTETNVQSVCFFLFLLAARYDRYLLDVQMLRTMYCLV